MINNTLEAKDRPTPEQIRFDRINNMVDKKAANAIIKIWLDNETIYESEYIELTTLNNGE